MNKIKSTSEWEEIPIHRFAKVKTGGTPSRKKREYWENGTIPWINSGKVQNLIIDSHSEFITENGLKNSAAKKFPKNTLVIALTGATTGKVGILNFECTTNQSVTGIYPSDRHDPFYLFSYLIYVRKKILHQTVGSAQPHINQGIVERFSVPLPPIEIQKKISNVLKKARKLNEKQKQIKKLTNNLIDSYFLKLFGDPINNPNHWKVIPMSKVILNAQYGISSSLNKSNGIPCLRMGNITKDGKLDLSDLKFFDGEKTEKYLLKKGDILFNRTNSRELVGKTTLFDLDEKITFAGYLVRLVTDKKKCNPYFLNAFMNLSQIKNKIRRMAVGSVGQANINAKKIQELEIYMPPITQQNNFENIMKRINNSLNKHGILSQQYDELLLSLCSKIFR